MTLRELQRHINETVAANDKNPVLSKRNDMRVCLEMRRDTKRYKTRVFELGQFYRGQVGHHGKQYGAEIKFQECEEVTGNGSTALRGDTCPGCYRELVTWYDHDAGCPLR